MPAKLSIDGNMWCFLDGENLQTGTAGFGSTIRDAQVNFNRKAGSTIRRPCLLGDEVRARYRLSEKEYEEMSVAEFRQRHEAHGEFLREGFDVRKS